MFIYEFLRIQQISAGTPCSDTIYTSTGRARRVPASRARRRRVTNSNMWALPTHRETHTHIQNSMGRFGIIRARERNIIRSHLRSWWPPWKLRNVPPFPRLRHLGTGHLPVSLYLSLSYGRFREREWRKHVSISLDDDRTWLRSRVSDCKSIKNLNSFEK